MSTLTFKIRLDSAELTAPVYQIVRAVPVRGSNDKFNVFIGDRYITTAATAYIKKMVENYCDENKIGYRWLPSWTATGV